MHFRPACVIHCTMLGALLMLGGCGNAGNGQDGGTAARVSASDIGQGLQPGEFELNISGFVETTAPYEGDGPAARFQPWTYSTARERADGFGGREQVETWNATGPYRLWLHAGVRREGEDDMASVWIQLPPEARGGRTYTIRHSRLARQGEAYAGLQRRDMVWRDTSRALEGTVTVAEIGDDLTLSFDFHNGREDEQATRVQGRAYRIPYMPRGEAFYTATADGEKHDIQARVLRQARDSSFDAFTTGDAPVHVGFDFDVARPVPGTYTFGQRRAPGVVGLSIGGQRFDSVDGSLELSETDGYYTAVFELSTQGDHPMSAQGRFEYIAEP
jgi:hypothetical protein